MNSLEMTEKIKEICKEYKIKIEWLKAGANCANRQQKKIFTREIIDAGDFAVALYEIGHVQCDPDKKPTNHRQLLDADTNAWKWALEHNNNGFDAEGWKRLHESLRRYYSAVMDTNHPLTSC